MENNEPEFNNEPIFTVEYALSIIKEKIDEYFAILFMDPKDDDDN